MKRTQGDKHVFRAFMEVSGIAKSSGEGAVRDVMQGWEQRSHQQCCACGHYAAATAHIQEPVAGLQIQLLLHTTPYLSTSATSKVNLALMRTHQNVPSSVPTQRQQESSPQTPLIGGWKVAKKLQ